ncbi:hypothetical protein [Actinomadura roseirufa]|uniref:hypothetical protein n=1 Tax=Actinomadura roseirufa TaxID=2094049 RepID=UPI001040EBEB|nr:hypothetical protein [Actinomadura roseirufa]
MRVPMVLAGVLLVTAGAAALVLGLGGLDGLGDLAGRPPLDPALARFARGHGWLLPAAAGAAEMLSLAGQMWLVLQCRAFVQQWRADVDPETRARARDAAGDLVRDAGELPGVRDARVRLTGSARRPRLQMTVVCDGDAVLGEVYGELGAGPVERYRRSLGMPDLPVVIRFRLAFPPPGPRHAASPA